MTVINYFQEKLPFNVPILKYAELLHPNKQNDSGTAYTISNIVFKICSVPRNCFVTVSDPVTKEDRGRLNQKSIAVISKWRPSKTLVFKYKRTIFLEQQSSYWKDVEEESGLQATANSKSIYKRPDSFWNHTGKIRND